MIYAVLGLCSLCVAVNQSSCYGVAGVFGSEFMCALETGKGWSGVAIIGIRILLKAAYGASAKDTEAAQAALRHSTNVFFVFGSVVVTLGVAAYAVLVCTPFAIDKFEEYYSMPDRPLLVTTPQHTPVHTPEGTPLMGRRSRGGIESTPPRKVIKPKFSPSLSRPRGKR